MSVLCVVQARSADIGATPLLAYLLHRVAAADLGHVVVIVTDQADGVVAGVARDHGAELVLVGAAEDALTSCADALRRCSADRVVRLTADCPLVDPALIRCALAKQSATGADYVSNTLIRTYPSGLDLEVVAAGALLAADAEATDPVERDNITPFVYRRPERFTLRALRHPTSHSRHRWTIDTIEDLNRVRDIVGALEDPCFAWERALEVTGPPPPAPGRTTLDPAMIEDAGAILALRNDPEAVRWSTTAAPVAPSVHAAWFASLIEDPSRRTWVAREDGDVVGQVRVDVAGGVGTISIAVRADERRRGVGTRMLSGLSSALSEDHQVHTLEAMVMRGNLASRSLFERARFSRVGESGGLLHYRRSAR
jgi:spore coat polysaccharide biosynthesis protein SpsF